MRNNNLIVLFIADIVGKPGLDVTTLYLPGLIKKYDADIIIANGENAHQGKGMTETLAAQYHSIGIDVITGGNHIWDNYKVFTAFKNDPNLLRPINYPRGLPGKGYIINTVKSGIKVGVLNIQGRTFMQPIDCPFQAAKSVVEKINTETNIIIVDFHAEATAEKRAMGWFLNGKVSAVLGTHTHIQTADEQILPGDTAYITDAGMTGPHHSVIGMKKEVAIRRFTMQTPHKYDIASDDVRFQGVVVEINPANGKGIYIERISLP